MFKNSIYTLFFLILLISSSAFCSDNSLKFCGGPSGGTFMFYANGISNLMMKNYIKVTALTTKGSIDNIRMVNSGDADFGIAYAGDIEKALKGEIMGDTSVYSKIRVVGFLYNAPVQVVVLKGKKITSLKNLAGKRIAVGAAGSGSAENAKEILSALGVWNKTIKYYIGYRNALGALNNGIIDAIWLMAGAPNPTIEEALSTGKTELINLSDLENNVEFKIKHPYLSPYIVKKGTYKNVTGVIGTLAESAIWITNENVSDSDVYSLMKTFYSVDGLKYMSSVHKSASTLKIKDGLNGVTTSLHPTAERFWKDRGVRLP